MTKGCILRYHEFSTLKKTYWEMDVQEIPELELTILWSVLIENLQQYFIFWSNFFSKCQFYDSFTL